MKLYRNLIIVVLAIALLGSGYYFVYQYDPDADKEEPEPFSSTTIQLFKTEKENIKRVTVTNPEGTYTVSKREDKWVINDDPSIQISQSRVDTLIYECASVSVRELIAEDVTDLGAYGLESPKRSVKIELQDGGATTILIGDDNIDATLSYLSIEKENKVYTKSKSGSESLTQNLSKLRDHSIYSINEENIGGFHIHKKGYEYIELVREEMSRENEEEEPIYTWKMKAPLIKAANDYNLAERVLQKIIALSADEVVNDNAQNLEEYGLASPAATYSVWDLEGKKYEMAVGKTNEGKTYVKSTDKNVVYGVEASKLDFVNVSYLELVDKLIHLENIADVSSVEVDGKGLQYVLEIGGTEEAPTYKINDKDIQEKLFKTAYQAVLGITLENYITQEPESTLEATIVYYKKDGSHTNIEFFSIDHRNYLVKVNGEGNFTIKKKQVDNILEKLEETVNS